MDSSKVTEVLSQRVDGIEESERRTQLQIKLLMS